MGNMEMLEKAFVSGLDLPAEVDVRSLEYRSIEQWDSVGHMALVTEIEDAFDVMLAPEDILDMSSFVKACELLAKHGIDLGV